jgi:hypothetical protein
MWTTTLYLLTTTLLLWTSAPKLHAQPEPPQRGDRYLPGEAYRGKCIAPPGAWYCNMLITPGKVSNCIENKHPNYGYVTPATSDPNSSEMRFGHRIPALHKCPELTVLYIEFVPSEQDKWRYPCSAAIPSENGGCCINSILIYPLDTMSMTYPISTNNINRLTYESSFNWYKTFQAKEFNFQIALNKDFIPQTKNDQSLNAALVMDTVIADNQITIPLLKTLTKNTIYYWRVRAKKNNQWQEWSAYTQFFTEDFPTSSVLEQTTTVITPTIANNTLTINDIAQAIHKEKLTVTITSLHGVQHQITTNDIQFTTDDIIINIQHLPIGWYAVQLNDGLHSYTTSLIKR